MNERQSQTTADAATVERVAKALYGVEWEAVSENSRWGHWDYESDDCREYWRRSARAAIAAYQLEHQNAE